MAAPRATLVCNGGSDRALLSLLRWLCAQHGQPDVQFEWANLYPLREPPRTLRNRIECALDLYPCDVLFVHRDAEGQGYGARATEIDDAVRALSFTAYIPVIPVRMTEAWPLSNEAAIRFVARNPAGQVPLSLPPVERLEDMPDPKMVLQEALTVASELPVRRRRSLYLPRAVHAVAEHTRDFGALRRSPVRG